MFVLYNYLKIIVTSYLIGLLDISARQYLLAVQISCLILNFVIWIKDVSKDIYG
jgi:hypothetical protein